MNIFSLLGGILIVLSPNAMKLIIKMSVNLLSKLKLFKTLNEKLNIINKFIDEYSYSINLFVKNKKALYMHREPVFFSWITQFGLLDVSNRYTQLLKKKLNFRTKHDSQFNYQVLEQYL